MQTRGCIFFDKRKIENYGLSNYIITKQICRDGNTNFHAYIEFLGTLDTESVTFLDLE